MRAPFAIVIAATLFAEPAYAQSVRPLAEAIEVAPPDDPCIDAASLSARVAQLISASELDDTIAIRVTIEEGTLTFVVERRGEEVGRRSFDALPTSCGARLGAVGLALALAIDHTLLERMSAEPPPPPPELPPPPPPSPYPRVAIGLDGALLLAILHEPAFGGAAAVELALDRIVSLRLRALAAYAPRAALTDAGHFESALAAAHVWACLAWRDDRVALGACAGVGAGFFWASGIDFAVNQATYQPWLGVSLEPFLAVTVVEPVAIRIGVAAEASVLVPTVTLLNPSGVEVARAAASPIGAAVTLGVLLRP